MADDHERQPCGCHGRYYSGIGWRWSVCLDHSTSTAEPVSGRIANAIDAVAQECHDQDVKWGADRVIPHGTGYPSSPDEARLYREACQANFAKGEGTWRDILLEEVYEAMAEQDSWGLRRELIQVAAVAVQWAAAIERAGEVALWP